MTGGRIEGKGGGVKKRGGGTCYKRGATLSLKPGSRLGVNGGCTLRKARHLVQKKRKTLGGKKWTWRQKVDMEKPGGKKV